jgi:hypothetical protein
MSLESYYAGCYWGARSEPKENCVRRAELLFRGLRGIDPSFEHWFEKGWSRKKALQLGFDPTPETLLKLLSRKKYVRRFGAWNGLADEDSTGVSFTSGPSDDDIFMGNCVLDPPSNGPIAERILSVDRMTGLLRLMVTAWEPDWGLATSSKVTNLFWNDDEDATPGWIMYFAHHRGAVPPLPAPARTEPVGDLGTLIVLTPERLTASNPAHVELATEVRERLKAAGLIRPRPPRTPPA